MRTATSPELARLNTAHTNLYVRVEVKDADGTYQDLTSVGGADWVESVTWSESIDRPVQTGTIELRRESVTGAFAFLQTDGDLEAGTAAGWTLETGWSLVSSNAHGGTYALAHAATAADAAARNPAQFACAPGDQFYAGGWVKGASADGRCLVRLSWLNSSHVELSTSDDLNVYPSDGTYYHSTVIGTAPASTAYVRAEFVAHSRTTGTWYADDLVLLRSPLSIAPFIQASPLNKDSTGAYAPLLELGRLGRIKTALVDHGATPSGSDYHEMLQFRIDDIDWSTNPIRIQISDIGAIVMDAQIETVITYGSSVGVAVESVMQTILDNTLGSGVVTLYTPSSPAWNIQEYSQDRVTALDAIRALALQIGWDVRYRYDSSDNFRLTFYSPDRAKTTPDATIGPTTYRSVTGLKRAIADIRNVVKVVYDTGSVTRTNSASVAKYGRRFMEIANVPNIDTGSEATDMAQAAVDDLGEPFADQEIETLFWWPAQLGDLYTFTANGDHYDADQKLAVVNIQHTIRAGEGITRLQTRGSVTGAFRTWLRVGGEGGGTAAGRDVFTFVDQSPDYAANIVTFLWGWDGDPTATFNLWREFNPVSGTPASYVLDGSSPLAAGTISFDFTTTLVDIDASGTSQCNVGFYLEAIVGSTVVAASVKNEVIYNRN